WQVCATAMILLFVGHAAGAHEIGKTQVMAIFTPDNRYQIDIIVDPDTLVTKLAVKNGELPPAVLNRVERDRQIEARSKTFVDSVSRTSSQAASITSSS